MRCAILGDIHANLTALEAVIRDAESRHDMDEVWCLGDIVDYGPDPHECIELVRHYSPVCIAGNHDWGAVGKMDLVFFPPRIAVVTRWTAAQLTDEDRDYLARLPLTLEKEDFTLVHGSPRDPIWEYILTTIEAEENLRFFKTRYCLHGHSHVPLVFECDSRRMECNLTEIGREYREKSVANRANLSQLALENRPRETVIKLGEKRLYINPGGVGQPRDSDPRACYAVYDSELKTIIFHRVEYDVAATQRRMVDKDMPEWLIERLAEGR